MFGQDGLVCREREVVALNLGRVAEQRGCEPPGQRSLADARWAVEQNRLRNALAPDGVFEDIDQGSVSVKVADH